MNYRSSELVVSDWAISTSELLSYYSSKPLSCSSYWATERQSFRASELLSPWATDRPSAWLTNCWSRSNICSRCSWRTLTMDAQFLRSRHRFSHHRSRAKYATEDETGSDRPFFWRHVFVSWMELGNVRTVLVFRWVPERSLFLVSTGRSIWAVLRRLRLGLGNNIELWFLLVCFLCILKTAPTHEIWRSSQGCGKKWPKCHL